MPANKNLFLTLSARKITKTAHRMITALNADSVKSSLNAACTLLNTSFIASLLEVVFVHVVRYCNDDNRYYNVSSVELLKHDDKSFLWFTFMISDVPICPDPGAYRES